MTSGACAGLKGRDWEGPSGESGRVQPTRVHIRQSRTHAQDTPHTLCTCLCVCPNAWLQYMRTKTFPAVREHNPHPRCLGRRYEGEWQGAVYAGAGCETFAKGSTYQGEYSGGLRQGWGTCRFHNGDYYEGQWAKGVREGVGMQQVRAGAAEAHGWVQSHVDQGLHEGWEMRGSNARMPTFVTSPP
jgi:hypothetical protein